jgi:hypothetical protein
VNEEPCRDGLPVYLVRLKALPDAVPAAARLKRLLKWAGRSLRLKCLDAREDPRGPAGGGAGGGVADGEEVTDKQE